MRRESEAESSFTEKPSSALRVTRAVGGRESRNGVASAMLATLPREVDARDQGVSGTELSIVKCRGM